MRYALDIRTLSLTSCVVSLILCICMFYVYRCRKTYSGFLQWAIAAILNALGMGFLSMRGLLPEFITIVIANTLVVGASGFIADGLGVFLGCTRRRGLFILIALSTFVLFIYCTYYSPNTNARIVVISLMLSVLYGYSAYVVHRCIPRVLSDRNLLLSSVFSIQALACMLRIFPTVFIEGPIVDFMRPSILQGASFVVFLGGNIFVTIGLIVLNAQRVELDLQATMEEVKTLRGIIPICSSCKKIRSDAGIWHQIEVYIHDHSEAEFSHSICPECMKELYPEYTSDDG